MNIGVFAHQQGEASRTGGLADTVQDASEENILRGVATGFVFEDYKPEALAQATIRALDIYSQAPEVWSKIVTSGMSQDWSWAKSADAIRISDVMEAVDENVDALHTGAGVSGGVSGQLKARFTSDRPIGRKSYGPAKPTQALKADGWRPTPASQRGSSASMAAL